MCMEDIRIGRQTTTNQVTANLTTASQKIIQDDPMRVLLIIFPPVSGTITLGLLNPVVAGQAFNLDSTDDPLVFDIKKEGTLVTKGFYCLHDAGGLNMNWIEGRLDKQ